MEEIWKDAPGFEGIYLVSNLGNVMSINYRHTGNPRILKPKLRSGYLAIHRNSSSGDVPIHRLVAKAFIPNPNNLPQVNHKDENKANNNLSNLEWCNAVYNLTYNSLQKRSHQKQKRRIKGYNSTETVEFESVTEAALYLTHLNRAKTFKSALGNLVTSANKGNKLNYGYHWEWLEESKRLKTK